MPVVLDHGRKIRKWLAKRRPQMANSMLFTDKVLKAVGEVSGVGPISHVGYIFAGVGNLIMKWNNKVNAYMWSKLFFF